MTEPTQDPLNSFSPFDEEPLELVDRSTLERYTVCPAQARWVESGSVLSTTAIMETGQAVHDACSQTISDYLGGDLSTTPGEIADWLMGYAQQSRPDVQPDAVAAVRRMAWSFGRFLGNIHPANILRYDGGDGERSGQLAYDMHDLGVRVTSEVDLLYAGRAKEVLHEVDFKSGWKQHTSRTVETAFQFQLHALLILTNYPEAQAAEIAVWNTRRNNLTYPVLFERRDLAEIDARVRSAAREWNRNRHNPPEKASTWPTIEKCEACPAMFRCAASKLPYEIYKTEDPVDALEALVVFDAAAKSLRKLLAGVVEKQGTDIVTPSGNAFGIGKPKTTKPTKSLYRVSQETETQEDEPCELP